MLVNQHNIEHLKTMMTNFNRDEFVQVRDYVDNRIAEMTPGEREMRDIGGVQGPDSSADSEKKKYIAQHGSDKNAQETAQSVPEPVSDEVKDMQNKEARKEHEAKGPAADGSH